jgi:4-aminobutyrate aminotransferase-like enzyme
VESRNVTYVSGGWPVFWEEARGANVRDADGNVYLDLTGAFGVGLLGHGHPGVVEAVQDQAGRLLHGMGDVHPPALKVELLERLAAVLPWPETRTVLASSGSEAVEVALKTAQVVTGKAGVLAFEGSYHGLTLGALATTSRSLFRKPFEDRLPPGVVFAPFPDPVRHGAEAGPRALARVEELLERGAPSGQRIGAVIVEPVQGRAGARVAPHGFMARLSRLAREAGALVIADEIFTGMGRCGEVLASTRVGLDPDLVCLGKALGGGMPLSACAGTAAVMDAWPESAGEAIHTSTFLGHPASCAAGLAVLEAMEMEGTAGRARVLGGRLVRELRARLAGAPGVADVRGLGLLLGIELVDGEGREPAAGRGARVAEAALALGVLVLPAGAQGHVVELAPSVDLTDEQVECALDVLDQAVRGTGG